MPDVTPRFKTERTAAVVSPDLGANVAGERARARNVCQAEGMHHKNCPGVVPYGQGVVHHRFPSKKDRRDDRPVNLLFVWNGLTSLGAGGCHGKIHQNKDQRAVELGLLLREPLA